MLKTFQWLLLLISFTTFAEDESTSYLNLTLADLLNVEVVTSSNYSEKNSDSPANIHIISGEQIRARGYKNIEDLLKNLPEVDLQDGI